MDSDGLGLSEAQVCAGLQDYAVSHGAALCSGLVSSSSQRAFQIHTAIGDISGYYFVDDLGVQFQYIGTEIELQFFIEKKVSSFRIAPNANKETVSNGRTTK